MVYIAGCVVGLIGCVAANFVVTEVVYEGGLSNFFINTIQDYSLLAGCVAGISLSSVCTIVTSLLTNKIKTEEDVAREWDKTIDQLQVRRGCHIVPPSHGFIVPATIFTLLYSSTTGHISKLWKLVKSITDDILFISLKINEQIIVYDFFLFKMSFQNCMMTSFFNISPIEQIEVVFPPKNFTNKRY